MTYKFSLSLILLAFQKIKAWGVPGNLYTKWVQAQDYFILLAGEKF